MDAEDIGKAVSSILIAAVIAFGGGFYALEYQRVQEVKRVAEIYCDAAVDSTLCHSGLDEHARACVLKIDDVRSEIFQACIRQGPDVVFEMRMEQGEDKRTRERERQKALDDAMRRSP